MTKLEDGDDLPPLIPLTAILQEKLFILSGIRYSIRCSTVNGIFNSYCTRMCATTRPVAVRILLMTSEWNAGDRVLLLTPSVAQARLLEGTGVALFLVFVGPEKLITGDYSGNSVT